MPIANPHPDRLGFGLRVPSQCILDLLLNIDRLDLDAIAMLFVTPIRPESLRTASSVAFF
jgi:hypothetical protein